MHTHDLNPEACRRLVCAVILQQARIYTGHVHPDPNTRGSLETCPAHFS